MSIVKSLTDEFEREVKSTRKHFARLPGDKLDWRPHSKSFTTRELASHILECIRWTPSIFTLPEVNFDPSKYESYRAASVAELLSAFDDDVAECTKLLARVTEVDLNELWRLKVMGRQLFEKTRGETFRDFVLSHMIHHRGQLGLYLRLLDVPVPGSYGPSADEQA